MLLGSNLGLLCPSRLVLTLISLYLLLDLDFYLLLLDGFDSMVLWFTVSLLLNISTYYFINVSFNETLLFSFALYLEGDFERARFICYFKYGILFSFVLWEGDFERVMFFFISSSIVLVNFKEGSPDLIY